MVVRDFFGDKAQVPTGQVQPARQSALEFHGRPGFEQQTDVLHVSLEAHACHESTNMLVQTILNHGDHDLHHDIGPNGVQDLDMHLSSSFLIIEKKLIKK